MRYLVIVERAGSNYSAYVPDLPGCFATGRKPAEVHENIRAAINLHLAALSKDGRPVPIPQTQADPVSALGTSGWLRRDGPGAF